MALKTEQIKYMSPAENVVAIVLCAVQQSTEGRPKLLPHHPLPIFRVTPLAKIFGLPCLGHSISFFPGADLVHSIHPRDAVGQTTGGHDASKPLTRHGRLSLTSLRGASELEHAGGDNERPVRKFNPLAPVSSKRVASGATLCATISRLTK